MSGIPVLRGHPDLGALQRQRRRELRTNALLLTARDVAETFQRSQKTHLDAIILDVNLAGENSVLLMELLKQSHPGVPIIIYTGLDDKDRAFEYLNKACEDHALQLSHYARGALFESLHSDQRYNELLRCMKFAS